MNEKNIINDTIEIPDELKKWLEENECTYDKNGISIPQFFDKDGNRNKTFLYAKCPLNKLTFNDHKFNPRRPNLGKVNELANSISSLSLLSPLTCAFIQNDSDIEGNGGNVFLLDGRHRYDALIKLRDENKEWAHKTVIDLKIYFYIEISEVYLLSTYLNKTRKALAKGEYYKVIVEIYENRVEELLSKKGMAEPLTEKKVFDSISGKDLTDKNRDLSIGRIVGLVAFDPEEEGSWYPWIGIRQQDKFKKDDGTISFCSMTAGNLYKFLSHLCYNGPYDDKGENRATEINNVLKLGEYFKDIIFKDIKGYDTTTATSVACKHWVLDALGKIIKEREQDFISSDMGSKSLMANTDIKWERFEEILKAYFKISGIQAEKINYYRKTKNPSDLKEAYTYQTQTDQIIGSLLDDLRKELIWL